MVDEEKIEETTPEIEQEKIEETTPETTETQEQEKVEEIDYSSYSNLGTSEQVKDYLADILPENPSKAEIEFAKRLLTKLNDDSEEEKEEEKTNDEEVIEKNKKEVLEDLPISENDFKSLKIWVSNQPDDYKEKIAKLTHWGNSPEEIKKAIIEANQDRIKSASGAIRVDNSSSGYTPVTKEEIKKEYENIYLKFNGDERKNKLNELKSKAKSIPKLSEWAEYFF